MAFARRFEDLVVYQLAFKAAGRIFQATKTWPAEERYGLSSQIRNSSRSVCGNIAEAWRKRRYPNHFVSKLTDADGEAAETQNWLNVAVACGYMTDEEARELYADYDRVAAGLVEMMSAPQKWCGPAQMVREEGSEYSTGGSSLRSQALANSAECERRRARLMEPHVVALTTQVAQMRTSLNKALEDIPDFDPEDGGVSARVLLLLQDPGSKAVRTGFISRDNPDFTALCMNECLHEAGLARDQYAIWNLVPWRGARYPADIEPGRRALIDVTSHMPDIRVVIAFGREAQRGLVTGEILHQGVSVLDAPHPSPLNTRTRPESRARIVDRLTEAARLLR